MSPLPSVDIRTPFALVKPIKQENRTLTEITEIRLIGLGVAGVWLRHGQPAPINSILVDDRRAC
jgi:hypothetical protein